jgi:hypothetical protein
MKVVWQQEPSAPLYAMKGSALSSPFARSAQKYVETHIRGLCIANPLCEAGGI